MKRRAAAVMISVGVMAGCSDQSSGTTQAAGQGLFRMTQFCSVPGLEESLRHTYLLIDESALVPIEDAQEFADRNGSIRDIVLAFADPARATQAGTSDYRERISLLLLPVDGRASELIFEGCLPALSPKEIEDRQRDEGALASFFSGGVQQLVSTEADAFRGRLVIALVQAARNASEDMPSSAQSLPGSPIVASLRASGRLISGEKGLPRVVLLSDLSAIDIEPAENLSEARSLGFQHGAEAGINFGRADLHVLSIQSGASPLARDYAEAFFLAQHARLLSWSGGLPAVLPQPPVRVQRFSGTAQYPEAKETVQIRLASDRDGKVVDSWVVLRGSRDRSTPLTGHRVCEDTDQCLVRSDDGGFAQAWSYSTGGEPVFANEAPFGGLRQWEFLVDGEQLEGRVFDPAVGQIGPKPGIDVIPIEARLVENAIF